MKNRVTFLLCDPGWCVHKSDVQNKRVVPGIDRITLPAAFETKKKKKKESTEGSSKQCTYTRNNRKFHRDPVSSEKDEQHLLVYLQYIYVTTRSLDLFFFLENFLVSSPSETWFRDMSVGGSFRRV